MESGSKRGRSRRSRRKGRDSDDESRPASRHRTGSPPGAPRSARSVSRRGASPSREPQERRRGHRRKLSFNPDDEDEGELRRERFEGGEDSGEGGVEGVAEFLAGLPRKLPNPCNPEKCAYDVGVSGNIDIAGTILNSSIPQLIQGVRIFDRIGDSIRVYNMSLRGYFKRPGYIRHDIDTISSPGQAQIVMDSIRSTAVRVIIYRDTQYRLASAPVAADVLADIQTGAVTTMYHGRRYDKAQRFVILSDQTIELKSQALTVVPWVFNNLEGSAMYELAYVPETGKEYYEFINDKFVMDWGSTLGNSIQGNNIGVMAWQRFSYATTPIQFTGIFRIRWTEE